MSSSKTNRLRVGITGGIGSGKSTVCRIFSTLGVPVYEADLRARRLMNTHPEIIREVKELLGAESYLPDGKLNRAFVGNEVFSDESKLTQLNQIVHPRTAEDFETWYSKISPDTPWKFVVKEAAILFESGAYQHTDFVIQIYAPKRMRMQRVAQRDSLSPDQVLKRMDKQWPESQKLLLADQVIYNDGQHLVIPQVLRLAQSLQQRGEKLQ